jgi:hypothetical protein
MNGIIQEKVDVGNSTKHDHTYATTPALLQHQLKTARQRIQHLEHEARNAKLREKRAKLTLESTLNELKQLKHINDEQLQQLKVYRGEFLFMPSRCIHIGHDNHCRSIYL